MPDPTNLAFRPDLRPGRDRSGDGLLPEFHGPGPSLVRSDRVAGRIGIAAHCPLNRSARYAPGMAFDEVLGERVRMLLGDDPDVSERRMFGGLVFMVAGNMACGVTGEDLLVRVGRDAYDAMVAQPFARPMQMGDRTMGGFVVVDGEGVAEDDQLDAWIDRGVAYAVSLPPK